jgi:hypothetical protein
MFDWYCTEARADVEVESVIRPSNWAPRKVTVVYFPEVDGGLPSRSEQPYRYMFLTVPEIANGATEYRIAGQKHARYHPGPNDAKDVSTALQSCK